MVWRQRRVSVAATAANIGRRSAPISRSISKSTSTRPAARSRYDVSGAEYSDTILYIEGSPLIKGEIWVGTDDGLVQLTRDGGAHWQNVTPPGVAAVRALRDGRAVAARWPARRTRSSTIIAPATTLRIFS